jgi:hypothetical protein
MKKALLMLVLLIFLTASVSPAYAAGPRPNDRTRGRTPFALVGTITAIDGNTVTVRVVVGNHLVKRYYGQEVPLETNAATRFLMKDANGVVYPITLDDLEAGQNVSVNGVLANNRWVATRITVGARLIHLP